MESLDKIVIINLINSEKEVTIRPDRGKSDKIKEYQEVNTMNKIVNFVEGINKDKHCARRRRGCRGKSGWCDGGIKTQ